MNPCHRVVFCALPILIAGSMATLGALATEPVTPPSDRVAGLSPLEAIQLHRLPPVDVGRLLAEDAEAQLARRDVPLRVGFPLATDLTPERAGMWETLDHGSRLWRLRVQSAGARWLVLGFGTFRLESGAALWVYDPTRRDVHGPFGPEQVRQHGQLWLPPIAGDTVVVELEWPASLVGSAPRLHLGTVVHGYKRVWDLGEDIPGEEARPLVSGPCNIDVNCPLGSAWQSQKRGAVQLLAGGSAFCSGSLINNTGNDCKPYVLTARHCLSTQSAAAGTTFRFNFERPECESGTAPTGQTVTGSTLLSSFLDSDFTLLQLDQIPPESYAPFFSGWSRSTLPATESWCIHHPSGDVKKISFNDDPLLDGQSGGWGIDHWRVTEWELGTTEGGSSGSPLFDQNRRIVGQLHGGYASCSAITWDEYGKLDVSWTGGGTPTSRLSNWLDPLSSDAVAIDGIELSYCLAPRAELAYGGYVAHEILGNGDGAIDPGEMIALEVLLDNAGNAPATAVAGALSAASPLVAVGGADATWPDIPAGVIQATAAPHFLVQLDPARPCGESVALRLDVSCIDVPEPLVVDLALPVGHPSGSESLFADDVESGPGAWQTVPLVGSWVWTRSGSQSHSAVTSWYVKNGAQTYDTTLVMPALDALPHGATLVFWHRFDTEANRDGGVLETSLDDGASWQDAGPSIVAGGYTGGIGSAEASPLAGRPAWSGDSAGWQRVEVDLAAFTGASVSLRWRFATNDAIGDVGWFVDDLTVERTLFSCAARMAPPGEASAPSTGVSPFLVGRSGAGYALSWSAPGTGGAPLGYRLYRWPLGAMATAAPECETGLGPATTADLAVLPDDCGFVIVAANSLGEGSYGHGADGQERPPAQPGDICP